MLVPLFVGRIALAAFLTLLLLVVRSMVLGRYQDSR
jgi:hypothetical protein